VRRYISRVDLANIANWPEAKVPHVYALQFNIDLGRQNAPVPEARKRDVKSTETGEQVDESERRSSQRLDAPPRSQAGNRGGFSLVLLCQERHPDCQSAPTRK
jgi:hypothetical protein